MKHFIFLLVTVLGSSLLFSQRGKTGDETFAHRLPDNVYNTVSNASLKIVNEVDHDIIVLVRDQDKKYVRHAYIRNKQTFVFEDLPITRLYVQFKSKEFYFEDKERTVINFGVKHTFNFFFDASKEGNYFKITEEEFFKP
jgi:hypothetical protein